MLSLDWHSDFSLAVALFALFLIFLQSNAVSNGLHRFPYWCELLNRLLNAASIRRHRLQAMFQQVYEGFTVNLAHTWDIKRNAINLEFCLCLIIVKLGLVKSNELQYHHSYGKHIRLVDIILDLILKLVDKVQLLRWKNVVVDLRALWWYLIVTAMFVVLFHFQQVQLHISFRTEINRSSAVLSHRNAVFLQVPSRLKQRPHDINKLRLRKNRILQLLLLHGPL